MAAKIDDVETVVIDQGSTIKVGVAGNDIPYCTFQTSIGRWKESKKANLSGLQHSDIFVGLAIDQKRSLLDVHYPIKRGSIDVANWDDMAEIYKYAFQQVRAVPEEHPLLLSESPLTPKATREKITTEMFETFRVPLFALAAQGVLAIYASGRTTAVALCCGDGVTHCVPSYEGYALRHACRSLDLAGSDVTAHLTDALLQRGYTFPASLHLPAIVRDIKEKHAYVAFDYQKEREMAAMSSELEKSYELPDGQVITVSSGERSTGPEALFNPSIIQREEAGIHELLFNALLTHIEVDLRSIMLNNIVLAGGTTLLPGFNERLRKELTPLAHEQARLRTVAPPERLISDWIGGSILGSLSTFPQIAISRMEYDEIGPRVIQRKCF